MILFRTAFLLLSKRWKRFASIICLIALLSVVTGLLGSVLLYSDRPVDPFTIVIVDLDNTMESRIAYMALTSARDKSALLDIRKSTSSRAAQMLDDGLACAVFTIPKGFTQSIYYGDNAPVTAVYNPRMPLRSSLVKLLADTALDMLRTSQTGIYSVLDYAAEYDPDNYGAALQSINQRYINWALANSLLFGETLIVATGDIALPVHYLVYAFVFLSTLSVAMLSPVIREGFSGDTVWRLRGVGVGGGRIALGWISAASLWFIFCAVILAGFYLAASSYLALPLHLAAIPALLLLCLQLAAFSCLVSFLFKNETAAGGFLVILAIISLVISGGVLPHSFLPPAFSGAATFFPSYWSGALLCESLYGRYSLDALIAVAASTVIMAALAALCVSLRGKAVRSR